MIPDDVAAVIEQAIATMRCGRHNGGTGPCRVLESFDTYDEAQAWARESAAYERTRFVVHPTRTGWGAIQSWLRTM